MTERFQGANRKELHRMVDRVFDSGNASVISTMSTTLPVYVSCVEAAEKRERIEKAIALEVNRRVESHFLSAYMINNPESIETKGTNGGRP